MKDNIFHLICGGSIASIYFYLLYRIRKTYLKFKYKENKTLILNLWLESIVDLKEGKKGTPFKPPTIRFVKMPGGKALRLIKYNEKLTEKVLLSSDFRNDLGNAFNQTYSSTKKIRKNLNRQPEYIFVPQNNNIIHYKKEKLPPYHVLLGYDDFSKKIILNLNKFFAIQIVGSGDSGKSVLLSILIDSYNRSLNRQAKLLILNAKQPNDDPALGYLKESDNVTWLNPLVLSELDQAIEILESTYYEFTQGSHNRKKFKDLIIVLEEAGQYLKIEKSDPKDITDKKRKFINLVKKHSQLLRFTKIPLIIATQGANENEIDVPKSYFKAIISGKMNQSMSKVLTGDSDFLTDATLTNGRFGVNILGNLSKFKCPIMKSYKDSSFKAKNNK